MSACISRQGEFSEHLTTDDEFTCSRCYVLDEDALLAARDAAVAEAARARAEVERLTADNRRLRGRIHEAVDECQRRYAPGVKELGRLLSVRNTARRHFEDAKEEGVEWSWWALTSEVARAYVADLIDDRDRLAAALGRIEALCDETERHGWRVPVVNVRAALSDAEADEGRP